MSEDRAPGRDPAIALLEFDSIAVGIGAGDAMVKASPLGTIYTGTVQPGKYLVLVSGDTASVEEAVGAGVGAGSRALVASMFLPDVHPGVVSALTSSDTAARFAGEALGIVEAGFVAPIIEAADAGIKAADVELIALPLADGLGGKGYALFAGVLAEVEVATEVAAERAEAAGALLRSLVIAQLHAEMADNLRADLGFGARVRMHRAGEA